MFARLTYFLYAKRRMLAVLVVALFLWAQAQPADAIGFIALGILAVLGAGGGFALFKWGGGLIGEVATKALEAFVGILNSIAGATSALMQLLGQFFGFVLVNVNGSVSFYNNEFVRFGWGLVRDFANMGFAVFFLIAAIATILGIEQYGLKRLVPRIVIVGLLVNFSLPLTALVVNFSQLLLQFFVIHLAQQAGYADIANAIVNGMRAGEIVNISSETNLGSAAVSALFEIIFNLIAAATFLLLGVVFLLRIIALWVLMILSPLAIVAAVLPATQQHFKQWLGQFVHWSTFGIIAAFFMYLATALSFFVNSGQLFGARGGGALEAGQGLASFFGAGEHIFAYITILVFLYMALAVARQGAGAMAQTVVASGGAFAAGALGLGMGVAGRPALRRGIQAARESEAVRGVSTTAGKIASRIPLLGGVGERLQRFGKGEPVRAEVGKERQKAEEMDSKTIMSTAHPGLRAEEKIARAQVLIERGDVEGIDEWLEKQQIAQVAGGVGDTKTLDMVLGRNPEKWSEAKASGIERYKDLNSKQDAARAFGSRYLSAEAAKDYDIVSNLPENVQREIIRSAKRPVVENMTKTFRKQAAVVGELIEQDPKLRRQVELIERSPRAMETVGEVAKGPVHGETGAPWPPQQPQQPTTPPQTS